MNMWLMFIRDVLREQHKDGYDVRHVAAYMLCACGSFTALGSSRRFVAEVLTACACIDASGRDAAEALAQTYMAPAAETIR